MATFLRRAAYWFAVLFGVLASGFLVGVANGALLSRDIAGYVVPIELALVLGIWRAANEGPSDAWQALFALQLVAMVAGAMYGAVALRQGA